MLMFFQENIYNIEKYYISIFYFSVAIVRGFGENVFLIASLIGDVREETQKHHYTTCMFLYYSIIAFNSFLKAIFSSLFCKLGVLVRNRISLFGKKAHFNASANAFISGPSLHFAELLFSCLANTLVFFLSLVAQRWVFQKILQGSKFI